MSAADRLMARIMRIAKGPVSAGALASAYLDDASAAGCPCEYGHLSCAAEDGGACADEFHAIAAAAGLVEVDE